MGTGHHRAWMPCHGRTVSLGEAHGRRVLHPLGRVLDLPGPIPEHAHALSFLLFSFFGHGLSLCMDVMRVLHRPMPRPPTRPQPQLGRPSAHPDEMPLKDPLNARLTMPLPPLLLRASRDQPGYMRDV